MITLTLLDEVNCHFGGLHRMDVAKIVEMTKITEKGAHMKAAFKLGEWDGKVSLFSDDGFCFTYMIPQVIAILLEYCEYSEDDFEIIDERENVLPEEIPLVDENFLIDEIGFPFRPHQLESVNLVITERKGMLNLATNAGKTWICLAISKILDPYIKTLLITPSESLCEQTYREYEKSDLSTLWLNPKVKPKNREKMIKSHRHIITTDKLFQNTVQYFQDEPYGLMIDEAHRFGDVLADLLRFDMNRSPVRVGMTGTVPEDKLKKEKIYCHLGGGELIKVTQRDLINQKFASDIHIEMISTQHKEIEELFKSLISDDEYDWSIEENYLLGNKERAVAIGDWLQTLEPMNTLVLCQAEFGKILAKHMGLVSIDKDIPVRERKEMLKNFDETDDHFQIASFDTTGTGLSYNKIFRLVMIDAGKDKTNFVQGIGRVIRLDGEVNFANVIDISARTKYSQRHKKERIKMYKNESHSYKESNDFIFVA